MANQLSDYLENGIPIDFKLQLDPADKMQIAAFVLFIIAIIVLLKNVKLL